MYKEASEFAIQLITVGGVANKKESPESNFKTILVENLGDDEQDKLIVLDYLVIDFVLDKHNLSSS
jgi:hypothetical protein